MTLKGDGAQPGDKADAEQPRGVATGEHLRKTPGQTFHPTPQMMEIARNPSRLQEMTRTMDRQMQNLESMPGGQV